MKKEYMTPDMRTHAFEGENILTLSSNSGIVGIALAKMGITQTTAADVDDIFDRYNQLSE